MKTFYKVLCVADRLWKYVWVTDIVLTSMCALKPIFEDFVIEVCKD